MKPTGEPVLNGLDIGKIREDFPILREKVAQPGVSTITSRTASLQSQTSASCSPLAHAFSARPASAS